MGNYPAGICCNLTNGKMPHQGNGCLKQHIPYVAENGIVVLTDHTRTVYKYFSFDGEEKDFRVRILAEDKGELTLYCSGQETPLEKFSVEATNGWIDLAKPISFPKGKQELIFVYHGNKDLRMSEFSFGEQN